MVKRCYHAMLIVFLTALVHTFSGISCYGDLFGDISLGEEPMRNEFSNIHQPEDMKLFQDILGKKEKEEEITLFEDHYSPNTIVPTKKHTSAEESSAVLHDMKNKKLLRRVKAGENIVQVLESLSYDEDQDDDDVTLYKIIFSHERTTPIQKKITQTQHEDTQNIRGKRKTIRGSQTTVSLRIDTSNTTNNLATSVDTSKYDSHPKQITSKEEPLYEYYLDVINKTQTRLKRRNSTVRFVDYWGRPRVNRTETPTTTGNKTRQRRIRTTTEYKVLRTEKNRNRFNRLRKKYEHIIIGKLPNTTIDKEKNCLEKEILHIFKVENMTRYLNEIVHYYKNYRRHFDNVIDLVKNVSIFDIETDNLEELHKKVAVLPNSSNNKLDLKHNTTYEKGSVKETPRSEQIGKQVYIVLPTQSKPRTIAIDWNDFESNKNLNEKFDLTALNNLFNDEKKVITDDDRQKYDRINYNMKHIAHCLKLNLNMNKYNYINDTNVEDLMQIIWKNKKKYDEASYASEYEDLYEMAKTLDYYEVSHQYRDQYEHYLNEHSGIEEEEPFTRNLETQNVIKDALRNISRLRKERNEFDRGIIEGQIRNRCHYCGKNYSESKEYRYMKHVHNHIVDELVGSTYDEGVYAKEEEIWRKALTYMTKATHSTPPTIDILPFYQDLGSNERDYMFELDNYTTRGLEDFVKLKRKDLEKKDKIDKNIVIKKQQDERDKDIEDMKKFINKRDFVTFSDESLPGAIKRFVKKFVNNTDFFMNQTKTHDSLPLFSVEKTTKTLEPSDNILEMFEEKKKQQDEYRINELKKAASELLKQKDWRSRLNMPNRLTTPDINVEKREDHIKKMKKMQQKRYQQKLLKEKKQREMQQMWQEDNMNADKWIFKTNVWTTLQPY